MLDTILSGLFLLAIGQAVILAAALLSARQPEMRTANRLLSALLLIFSAILGHTWLGLNDLYPRYPHSALAIATLGFAVGPLLYLYLLLFSHHCSSKYLQLCCSCCCCSYWRSIY